MLLLASAARAQAPFDGWLHLDGVNDIADCPDSADLWLAEPSSLTVELWFQADGTEPYPMQKRPLVVKRGSWSLSVELDASYMGGYDCIAFEMYTDDSSLSGSAYCYSALDTGWHHVAMVLDNPGNTFELYVDGQRRSSITQPTDLRTTTYAVEIGQAVYSAYTWDGRVDEVRISSSVRYSGTTYTVPSAPFACDGSTLALWHFDECPGASTLYDGDDGAGSQCGAVEDTLTGSNGAETGGPSCSYSLDPTSESYPAAGGSGSFAMTAPPCCSWTSVSNDGWITVTGGASGSGDGTVSYSVAANAGPARSGTITSGGQTFTVNQASGCTYGIDPTSADYPVAGGSGSVDVTTSSCPWTAVSNDAWITVTAGASGTGNGSVGYSVDANSGPVRTGTVTIAEQTFTVNQESGCTYALAPAGSMVAGGGGSGSLTVTTQAGCTWSASVETVAQGWLSITAGSPGTGSGTVDYAAAVNSVACTRQGSIEVAGEAAVIHQEGAASALSWTSTGDLATDRRYHEAVRLADGRVLAAGGETDTVEIFDPGTGTWSTTAPMTVHRIEFGMVLLPDGRVMVAGGKTDHSGGSTDTAEIYDPTTETWTQLPSMTCTRPETRAVCLFDGRVLVIGGRNSCADVTSEIYDPITGEWTVIGMTEAYFGHTATRLLDGRVLVAGSQMSDPRSAEIFDPATDTWTETGSLADYRFGHSAVLLPNGRVIIAGGGFSSTEEYDPSTGAWTTVGSLSGTISGATMTVLLDGRALVLGWDQAETYSPATQTWSPVTLPPRGQRSQATATLLRDGRILVAGGSSVAGACDLLDATAFRYINPIFNDFPVAGGGGAFAVEASAGCEWRASVTQDWLTATGATHGSGTGSVTYSVAASGEQARVGAIQVVPDLFFVLQTNHTLTVVVTGGGAVTSDPGGIDCGATCAAEFEHGSEITLNPVPESGSGLSAWSGGCSGSGACVVTLDAPTTVTAEFAPCSVAISPAETSIGAAGGSDSFDVISPTGCPTWTAISNDTWITVTAGGSGSGNGTVDY
jgi:hypothetical protein